ncbi:Methyltransferase domain-containing protein [Tistlia consotensis]|uniref:Methyltransferase domain-containing protein n=1 Tax=Tistlia consotensis USBA 355 TaxID=560819 RepID=A0A1Y6BAX0_9PROT|nr:class I SAM-dependent methyltransferase [Tistlia consotensis]SMF00288.1 Methyltransferase domain-containing protein [Tistlia consotensis USBA 355]SNR76013.1 Methyltransferase domain-containing protein [Tistlia consotensis]
MTVHRAAAEGFQAQATTYARGRPDYPPAVAGWLRDDLGLAAGGIVVDLGAGTGKFLPRLLATGATVLAVEPVAGMRAELTARHPEVEARACSADAIPLADASLDAVVCAQAFHWFANRRALAEIRRVLKPGGRLGLIWNVRDESVDWVAALTRILEPYEGDTPRFRSLDWSLFPADGFGPLVERRYPQGHSGPAEQVILDRMLSVSFIAALPAEEREAVAAAIRRLIAATPALAGRAEVTFPYETRAYSCTKLA